MANLLQLNLDDLKRPVFVVGFSHQQVHSYLYLQRWKRSDIIVPNGITPFLGYDQGTIIWLRGYRESAAWKELARHDTLLARVTDNERFTQLYEQGY